MESSVIALPAAATADVEIVSAEPLERVPRKLPAAELLPLTPVTAAAQTSADAAGSDG